MQLSHDSQLIYYLPVKVFSVSFSNKLAMIKFMTSSIIIVCVRNKLKLYFVCIIIFNNLA